MAASLKLAHNILNTPPWNPMAYPPSSLHHCCPSSPLGPCELRVDLRDFENNCYFAKYASFRVLGESEKYRLVLGDFLGGNAGKFEAAHWKSLFPRAFQKCSASMQRCIMHTPCISHILSQFFKTGHGTSGTEWPLGTGMEGDTHHPKKCDSEHHFQAQPYGLIANEPGPEQHSIQLTFPTVLHQPGQGLLLVTLAGDICPGGLAFPGLGCCSILAASALNHLTIRFFLFFFK